MFGCDWLFLFVGFLDVCGESGGFWEVVVVIATSKVYDLLIPTPSNVIVIVKSIITVCIIVGIVLAENKVSRV